MIRRSICLPEKIFEALELARGDIPRSLYVRRVLAKELFYEIQSDSLTVQDDSMKTKEVRERQ